MHRYERSVLDTCRAIHEFVIGTCTDCSYDDIHEWLKWLRWRVEEAWVPSRESTLVDNAVREFARAVIREGTDFMEST